MANNLNNLPNKEVQKRLKKKVRNFKGEVDLEIGREYTVYGMIFWDSSPWYYLCAEDYDNYPVPFAADFFKVSDDRLSSYWRLFVNSKNPDNILPELIFLEWAQDPLFYEHLLDDYPYAIELFMKYRRLMDKEYF